MATLIKTNGEKTEVTPKNTKAFSLEELQGFVGGTIDMPVMPSGKYLVVNDQGKLDSLPKNEEATEVWKKEYPIDQYPENNDQLIVGDVLLLSKEEYDAMNDIEEDTFEAKKVL